MNGWSKAFIGAILLGALSWFWAPADTDHRVTGRTVYQGEGCIHCHSMYSRPIPADRSGSGPPSPAPDGKGEPVLIGNRRQGPDLSILGLRRSREWNRLHLIDPQAVTPGSRMPSYGHLFAGNDPRGDALLDYLGELGTDRIGEWAGIVNAWRVDATLEPDPVEGAGLFTAFCSPCHGTAGRGDGPLARKLVRSPADLVSGPGMFVPETASAQTVSDIRARIVKFGLPGTSMPGHEYLTDQQIVDLVSFLAELRAGPGTAANVDEGSDR